MRYAHVATITAKPSQSRGSPRGAQADALPSFRRRCAARALT